MVIAGRETKILIDQVRTIDVAYVVGELVDYLPRTTWPKSSTACRAISVSCADFVAVVAAAPLEGIRPRDHHRDWDESPLGLLPATAAGRRRPGGPDGTRLLAGRIMTVRNPECRVQVHASRVCT